MTKVLGRKGKDKKVKRRLAEKCIRKRKYKKTERNIMMKVGKVKESK